LDPPTKQFFLFLFFHLIGAKIVAKNCARVAMKLWRIEFTLTSLKKTRRAAVFGGTTMSIQKKIPGEKGRKHRPVNVTKKGKKGKKSIQQTSTFAVVARPSSTFSHLFVHESLYTKRMCTCTGAVETVANIKTIAIRR
jgi:hypothetical protein